MARCGERRRYNKIFTWLGKGVGNPAHWPLAVTQGGPALGDDGWDL